MKSILRYCKLRFNSFSTSIKFVFLFFSEIRIKRFAEKLKNAAGIKLFASTTSFMLAKLVNRHTADAICQTLLNEKILIRNCSNFKGLSNHFIRISLKNSETNLMLVEKLLSLSL